MKIIILHGTMGAPEGNWFPWLKQQLLFNADNEKTQKREVLIPRLPSPENQSLQSWFSAFDFQCGPLTPDTILVGHSCGATFLLRLLERYEQPILASAFVAPLISMIGKPEFDRLNESFISAQFRWSKIRESAGTRAVYLSDNDPYVPVEQMLDVASHLQIDPIVIPGAGHLNAESGMTSFAMLLDWVLQQAEQFERMAS